MVDLANNLYSALGDGQKKVESNESESAIVQRRALRFRNAMHEGQLISREDIIPLRPAPTGSMKPHEIQAVIGKKVVSATGKDELILRENIY
jgi:N-acetylneuraminate synthase